MANILVVTDTEFRTDKRGKAARAMLDHKGGSVNIISYKGFKNVKLDASLNFIIRDAKIKKFVYGKELDERGKLKRRFEGIGQRGKLNKYLRFFPDCYNFKELQKDITGDVFLDLYERKSEEVFRYVNNKILEYMLRKKAYYRKYIRGEEDLEHTLPIRKETFRYLN